MGTSKKRSFTKHEIFSVVELTNYAAHCTLALRYAIGFKADTHSYELPARPEIPNFLQHMIHFPEQTLPRGAGDDTREPAEPLADS